MNVTIKGTEVLSRINLHVPAYSVKRWVRGRVVRADGTPVVNGEVTIVADTMGPKGGPLGPLDGVPRRVVTDEEGRYPAPVPGQWTEV